MKNILTKGLVAAVAIAAAAIAGPWDLIQTQLDQFGAGSIPRVMALPAGGQPGIVVYNPVSNRPELFPPGTMLCVNSGTVSVCPGGTASQVVLGDGTLGALPSATPFNFGYPAAKTVVTGTSYQAADPTKAAVITISSACVNNSTLVAANPCTMTVRMGSSPVTCSTGTVYATLSATVDLGLVITQRNTTPLQIKLPIGGHFIPCATAGTWTITAVEQTAG